MAFWSSQKLEANLTRLTDDPVADMVDCNALTLRIGPEVYVTPGLDQPAPLSHTKQLLGPGAPIAVPPGQFAFLLTEEVVTIPPEVMGFISIKATYKLKGLVNVSGFHVDPGWTGRLIFTVFNAGPATIHLERGLPVFLLWIADLDDASVKHKTSAGALGIPPGVIGNITGVVDSIYALEKRMKAEIREVSDKQQKFRDDVSALKERQNKVLLYFGVAAVFGGAIVGAGAKVLADRLFPPPVAAVSAARDPAQPSSSGPAPNTNASQVAPRGEPAGARTGGAASEAETAK
jgi:dCTP deaminase